MKKKIISISLSLVLLLVAIMPVNGIAASIDAGEINGGTATLLTEQIASEVDVYAINQFNNHIRIAMRNLHDLGLSNNDITNYSLGKGLKLYQETGNDIFYYPVYCLSDIVAILSIVEVDDVLYSSFSIDFANELNDLFENENGTFILMENSGALVAKSRDKDIVLAVDERVEDEPETDLALVNLDNLALINEVEKNEMLYEVPENAVMAEADPLLESISLPVQLVRQPAGSKLCWAACIAMIIRYRTGTVMTALQVAQSIGAGAQDTGSEERILSSASRQGVVLNNVNGILSVSAAKSQLRTGKPVFMTFNAPGRSHAIVMKGFERYSSGSYYLAWNPTEDNIRSCSINTSTGVATYLKGTTTWTWVNAFTIAN